MIYEVPVEIDVVLVGVAQVREAVRIYRVDENQARIGIQPRANTIS